MYGFVYMTTNHVNGIKYIGRRKCQSPESDEQYLGSNRQLRRAIREYGRENFSKVILQACDTEKELHEAEDYWFKHYDVSKKNPEFYNQMAGGPPGFRSGKNHHMQKPQHKAKIVARQRELMSDPSRNPMKNPELVEKNTKAKKEAWKTKDRKAFSAQLKEALKDPTVRDKIKKSKTGKIWINDGERMKFVEPETFETIYRHQGYQLGMIKRRKQQ